MVVVERVLSSLLKAWSSCSVGSPYHTFTPAWSPAASAGTPPSWLPRACGRQAKEPFPASGPGCPCSQSVTSDFRSLTKGRSWGFLPSLVWVTWNTAFLFIVPMVTIQKTGAQAMSVDPKKAARRQADTVSPGIDWETTPPGPLGHVLCAHTNSRLIRHGGKREAGRET